MTLKTLGGLKLEGSDFQRSKALLLLAYLVLEGEKDRQFLAELFWQGSSKPLHNLNMTLTRLRKADEALIQSNDVSVSSTVKLDVLELEEAYENNEYAEVVDLYKKPFLDGLATKDFANELEEWIFEKREYFAALVREAKLQLAEAKAQQADFKGAAEQAADAYHLRYAPEPDEQVLERIFILLQTNSHRLVSEVHKEAQSYGLELDLSQEEARQHFSSIRSGTTPHNLPEYLSSFIGRQQELHTLSEYLSHADKRLISLVGLGGMGKTRLALEVAKQQLENDVFTDGVYFVALDALKDSQSIPYEIADAMNLSLRGDRAPVELLIKQLTDKHLLLVLDNYEHLIEAAPLCSQLLSQCHNTRFLVTSRERLNVEGEWVYLLQGLSKGQTDSPDLTQMQETLAQEQVEANYQDALLLFEQRAKQADSQFELHEANQKGSKTICQLVEGSPLAIELAASWVKLLSPVEIAQEIQQNLEILSSQSRTVKNRHQSIEAAFEYSWQMISDKEQTVLKKLSVFEGGFSKEAASSVASANLVVLSALVDKSLLRVSGEKRFDLHPLIKQFSASKLATVEEEQKQVQEKHALFFASLLENLFINRTKLTQVVSEVALLEALSSDYENALTSWRWFISNRAEQDISILANGLGILIGRNIRFLDGEIIFQDAKEQLMKVENFHIPSLALIMCHKAWCLMEQGFFQNALQENQFAISLLTTEPLHYAHWNTFYASSNFYRKIGLFKEGKTHALKAIEFADNLGLEHLKLRSQGELSILLYSLGDYQNAQIVRKTNHSYYKQQSLNYFVFMTLLHQGELHLATRDYVKARESLEESLKGLNNKRNSTALMRCLDSNAILELAEGNIDISFKLANKSLELTQQLEAKYYEARSLITLGRIALAKDDFDVSYKHLKHAFQLAHSHMAYSTQLTALNFLAELKVKQKQFEMARLWLEFIYKHESTEFWVKERAKELIMSLPNGKNKISNEVSADELTLEQIISELV